MKENKNEMNLNMNLPADVAEGTYANLAVISHSPCEFVIDFIRLMPGIKEPSVKSRIILSPENAKKVYYALRDNIAKYEQQFEEIVIHNVPSPNNSMPMSFGGGEA